VTRLLCAPGGDDRGKRPKWQTKFRVQQGQSHENFLMPKTWNLSRLKESFGSGTVSKNLPQRHGDTEKEGWPRIITNEKSATFLQTSSVSCNSRASALIRGGPVCLRASVLQTSDFFFFRANFNLFFVYMFSPNSRSSR
jgi:hypothetical protein